MKSNPTKVLSHGFSFILLALFLSLLALPAWAGAIEITNIDQLQKIGNDLEFPLDGQYVLTQNIDASATVAWNDGAGFEPIGSFSTPFTGSFDGQGHVITDLHIYRPSEQYAGLFGFISLLGEVHNLGLESGAVTGTFSGGLAGRNDGTVSNSYTTGAVTGSGAIGGLVGLNSGGEVLNSYATGAVTGGDDVGGLVGENLGTVSNSYATGAVTGLVAGGLVGYNEGPVSNSYAAGVVSGGLFVGGLVGQNDAMVANSFWDITTSGEADSAGGTGRTIVQMIRQATFADAGWNFDSIWTIDEGASYPYLLSNPQDPPPVPVERIFSSRFELEPGNTFTDCADCPTMVLMPAGTFIQGSPGGEPQSSSNERPQRLVTVPTFAMGQTAVTFAQWDACVTDKDCDHDPSDSLGNGDHPVIDVSWTDAQQYVTWLSNKTGHNYRLPSESEWEYSARAGTTGRFNTGTCITTDQANFNGTSPATDCPTGIFRNETLPVGHFDPNAFGLYNTHGNVWEWTEDCWNDDYNGAPQDGSAWETGDCSRAAIRGGSYVNWGRFVRSANRGVGSRDFRAHDRGFRVARSVTP